MISGSDLQYLGAFRTPTTLLNGRDFASDGVAAYAGTGLGYNPAGNAGLGSLLVGTGDIGGAQAGMFLGEITIPSPLGQGSDPTTLPAASWLQAMADVTSVALRAPYGPGVPSAVRCKSYYPIGTKLYFTLYQDYDNTPVVNSHGVVNGWANFATSTASGMYRLNAVDNVTTYDRQVAGWIVKIPTNWQSDLGNYTHISGNTVESIVGTGSVGCTAVAFTPGTLAAGVPASSKKLTFFNLANPQADFDNQDVTQVFGGAWYDTGVLFFGTGVPQSGVSPAARVWYGLNYVDWRNAVGSSFPNEAPPTGQRELPPLKPGFSEYATFGNAAGWPLTDTGGRYYNDPSNTAKGQHTSNYGLAMWVIDPNDLVKSFNGSIANPWQVPVARYDIVNGDPLTDLITGFNQHGSVAFDEAGLRIFISDVWREQRTVFSSYPVIHVFQIAAPVVGAVGPIARTVMPSG